MEFYAWNLIEICLLVWKKFNIVRHFVTNLVSSIIDLYTVHRVVIDKLRIEVNLYLIEIIIFHIIFCHPNTSRQRPYHIRLITEVKQCWARLVLGWVTVGIIVFINSIKSYNETTFSIHDQFEECHFNIEEVVNFV